MEKQQADLLIIGGTVLTMDAGFWFRDTQLGWYVGLSGLLHGFYTAAALDEFWRGVRGDLYCRLSSGYQNK